MPLVFDTLIIWPLFIAAVLFDLLIGEYPSTIHPVVWMGSFISRGIVYTEKYVNRISRFFGGAAIVAIGALVFGLPASLIIIWYATSDSVAVLKIISAFVAVFLLKSTFSISSLLKAAGLVYNALDSGDLIEARQLAARHLVSRDTSDLSEDEICAAVIESVTENLTDSVVAPWTFLFLGGPAAAFTYRFVNTCDSMMGYRTEKYEWLGKFAARLDDVLNFIPARIASWLIVFSAGISRGFSGRDSLKVLIHEHRATESPNAGWTMSAAAGALGVKLVKNGHYTINGGDSLPEREDIGRTIYLVRRAIILAVIMLLLFTIAASGFFL